MRFSAFGFFHESIPYGLLIDSLKYILFRNLISISRKYSNSKIVPRVSDPAEQKQFLVRGPFKHGSFVPWVV
jgi:hypothetical protein